jgi:hypothetical protein
LAQKLFVELNREAIGIPSDGAMVDLISDEEDFGEPDASEAEEDTALGDKEEEGSMADDGLLEQAVVPPNAPPST